MSTRIESWNAYREIEDKPNLYLWVLLESLKRNTQKLLDEGQGDTSPKVQELRNQQVRVANELVKRGEAEVIIPPATKVNVRKAAAGSQIVGMKPAALRAQIHKE